MHVSVCSDGLSSVHTVLKAGVSSWILSPILTTGGFLCFFLFVCSWVTGGRVTGGCQRSLLSAVLLNSALLHAGGSSFHPRALPCTRRFSRGIREDTSRGVWSGGHCQAAGCVPLLAIVLGREHVSPQCGLRCGARTRVA